MMQTQGSSHHWIDETYTLEQCCKDRGVEYDQNFITGKGTPCAKQSLIHQVEVCKDGGFSVPKELVGEVYKLLGLNEKGKKKMRTFEYEDGMFLNLDQVVSFYYDNTEINSELATADIYDVEVYVTTSDGELHVIHDPERVFRFVRETDPCRSGHSETLSNKDLPYLAGKCYEYYKLQQEKKEKA